MTPQDCETTGMECQIITMPNIARMAPMTKKAMIGNRISFKIHLFSLLQNLLLFSLIRIF